ncbi:MAG: arginase family protein [Rhizobiales bacterium]|nr:arginase family protein [Hyphomicrobiales bacterium]
MDVAYRDKPSDSKVVIIGLPFDCGSDPKRIGARFGPESIREQSHLISHFDGRTGINPLDILKLVDLGDAHEITDDIELAYPAIEQAMLKAIENDAIPISLGGDGAVALPQMRALSQKHDDLVVLHIDAHTDAYPIDGYNNATPFARAFEEGLINCSKSFHVGRRGSHMMDGIYDYTRQLGYNIIDMGELLEVGITKTFEKITQVIGERPVYLCWDMDFFDPSVVPGVCSPTWGGATSREGLQVLKACAGLEVVAVDINTISPPHDSAGMSAFLAGNIAYEAMMLMATKQMSVKHLGL